MMAKIGLGAADKPLARATCAGNIAWPVDDDVGSATRLLVALGTPAVHSQFLRNYAMAFDSWRSPISEHTAVGIRANNKGKNA
jgi:hypothetical protein